MNVPLFWLVAFGIKSSLLFSSHFEHIRYGQAHSLVLPVESFSSLQPRSCQQHRVVQLLLKEFLRQHLCPVRRDVDSAFLQFEQLHVLGGLPSAENKPQRLGFARLTFVTLQPVEVEFHLAFVCGLKVANLQIQRHEPAELAMVKQQVEVVIAAINLHPLLPLDETEAHAEFENECLHLPQNRGLNVLLRVRVFQSQEVQQIRIAKYQIGCQLVLLAQLLEFHRHQLGGLL